MMPTAEHHCAYCGRPAGMMIRRTARPLRWLLRGPYPLRWVCARRDCVESACMGR